jgi:hypothetical protein
MMQWLSTIVLSLVFPVVLLCSHGLSAAQTAPGSTPEARDMALVGLHDLQGRSAYQPIIQQQGGRFIAYMGHHGGAARNPQLFCAFKPPIFLASASQPGASMSSAQR